MPVCVRFRGFLNRRSPVRFLPGDTAGGAKKPSSTRVNPQVAREGALLSLRLSVMPESPRPRSEVVTDSRTSS